MREIIYYSIQGPKSFENLKGLLSAAELYFAKNKPGADVLCVENLYDERLRSFYVPLDHGEGVFVVGDEKVFRAMNRCEKFPLFSEE